MADRDVDGVNRAEAFFERAVFVAVLVVDVGLIDDRIDRDGGLTSRTVTDDELTLATADWNHRVDRHDAGLKRLVDRLTWDDTRSDLVDRIGLAGIDWALAVDRLADRIDDAAEEAHADRNGKELAGGAGFVAFLELGVVTEDNATDFVFFKVQRETEDATAEIDHFVIHDAGEAFEFGDTVGDGDDLASVGLNGACFKGGDFLFDLFDYRAHFKRREKKLESKSGKVS